MLQNIHRSEIFATCCWYWDNRLLVQPPSTSVAEQLWGCQVASPSRKLQVQPRLNPIRPGWGGGGSEARMAKLTAANQKPLILWCPNLVTFSFYPWDTFWIHFSKIGQSGGLLLLFSHRDVPKILKMKNFSCAWKLLKLTWVVNFGSRRTILDIKTHFFKVKPVFRG